MWSVDARGAVRQTVASAKPIRFTAITKRHGAPSERNLVCRDDRLDLGLSLGAVVRGALQVSRQICLKLGVERQGGTLGSGANLGQRELRHPKDHVAGLTFDRGA